jgi:hypothetical protein
MARLAQVYIRLRPYTIDADGLNILGDRASEIVSSSAGRYYEQPVDVDVALDEGTLKAVLTVVGSILFGGYTAISDYKDFRESIEVICKQSHDWGVDVCGGFTDISGANKSQIEKKEIRYKTPGELRHFLDDVEKAQKAHKKGDADEGRKNLNRAARRWRTIQKDLSPEEKTALQNSLQFEGLPPIEQWPKREVRVRLYDGSFDETAELQRDEFLKRGERGRAPTHSGRPPLKYRNTVHVVPSKTLGRRS